MAEANHVLHISMVLVWAGLRLKHAGFAEEKEWGDSASTREVETCSPRHRRSYCGSIVERAGYCGIHRGSLEDHATLECPRELLRYTLSRVVT